MARRRVLSVYLTSEAYAEVRRRSAAQHSSASDHVRTLIENDLLQERSAQSRDRRLLEYIAMGIDLQLDRDDKKLKTYLREVHTKRFGAMSDA